MSELNKPKKKNILIKIVLIYFVIALIATIALIILAKNDINLIEIIRTSIFNTDINDVLIESESESNDKNVTIKKSSYGFEHVNVLDKCFINNIKIEEVKEDFGDIITYDYENNEIHQVSLRYLKISGLKDKNVEDKINKKIKDTIYEIKDKYENKIVDGTSFGINAYNTFNNNNVLGFNISYSLSSYGNNNIDLDSEEYHSDMGLNFRLDTGDLIKLKDVFMPNTNIKQIISTEVYKRFATDRAMELENEDYSLSYDLDKIDYSSIENDVLKVMQEYNSQDGDVTFNMYPGVIYVYINLKGVDSFSIIMEDYYEDIAIYNRYLSNKSLFEDGDNGKDTYVFLSDTAAKNKLYKSFLNNVDVVNVYIQEFESESEQKYYDFYLNKVLNELKNYKYNSNKKYIVAVNLYYNTQSDERQYEITGNINMLEMDNDMYEKNYEYILRDVQLGDYTMMCNKQYVDYTKINSLGYTIKRDLVTDDITLIDNTQNSYNNDDDNINNNEENIQGEEISNTVSEYSSEDDINEIEDIGVTVSDY